jgi:pyridoxal phosphate enzyme (YggS family)
LEIDISQNIANVRRRIEIAAKKRGKAANDIALIAVTKTVSADCINQAISDGVKIIGENKVQEAREKFDHINQTIKKHMIGHLQRNKVKYAVKLFDMIQSVDTFRLAEEIDSRSHVKMPILIEVNTSGESSKYGCPPEDAHNLMKEIAIMSNLEVNGFMTIGIFSNDSEKVRNCFKMLKGIYDEAQDLNLPNTNISVLSMGMSADFEIAIEEGANMVRIGTAIFGQRPTH